MNKKVVKIAIIISWCLLGACVIFKLCGSKVFELAVTNQRFISICNWLDGDGIVLKHILAFILSIPSNTLILLASSLIYKPTWKELLIIEGVNIPIWFVKAFFPIPGFVLECVMFIVIPAVISRKWWTGFMGLALNVVFQLISMFLRGHDVSVMASTNTILSLVILIDYYIMVILYYLYMIMIKKSKKEVA